MEKLWLVFAVMVLNTAAKAEIPHLDAEGRKICTAGKPCGETCISMSYTCHINNSTPTSTSTPTTVTSYPDATADFTMTPSAGVYPLKVTLDAISAEYPFGNVSTYSWAIDNIAILTNKTVQHTFVVPKTYEIKLTVTDINHRTLSTTKNITVSAPQQITLPTSAKTCTDYFGADYSNNVLSLPNIAVGYDAYSATLTSIGGDLFQLTCAIKK